jgi:hypothetical protein
MKKILLTLIICFPILLWAQKDKYTKKVAEQTCDCLAKKDLKSIKGKNEVTMILGACMMKSDFVSNFEKIAKENDIDTKGGLNSENGRQLGTVIGMKLVEMECPSYMDFVLNYTSSSKKEDAIEDDNSGPTPPPIDVDEQILYTMNFVRIDKTDNLNFLVFKDNKGREIKIWWLEYFKGVEKLKEKDAVGKYFDCIIKEKEFYNSKVEDYVKVKVLVKLEESKK